MVYLVCRGIESTPSIGSSWWGVENFCDGIGSSATAFKVDARHNLSDEAKKNAHHPHKKRSRSENGQRGPVKVRFEAKLQYKHPHEETGSNDETGETKATKDVDRFDKVFVEEAHDQEIKEHLENSA